MLAEGCKNLNTHKNFEEICDDLLNFYFNELKQHEIVLNQKKFTNEEALQFQSPQLHMLGLNQKKMVLLNLKFQEITNLWKI